MAKQKEKAKQKYMEASHALEEAEEESSDGSRMSEELVGPPQSGERPKADSWRPSARLQSLMVISRHDSRDDDRGRRVQPERKLKRRSTRNGGDDEEEDEEDEDNDKEDDEEEEEP